MELLQQHIEALIFATPHAVSTEEIKSVLDEVFQVDVDPGEIAAAIHLVQERYKNDQYAFESKPRQLDAVSHV